MTRNLVLSGNTPGTISCRAANPGITYMLVVFDWAFSAPTNGAARLRLLASSGAAAWPPARAGDGEWRSRGAAIWLASSLRIRRPGEYERG